jgi:hypothetical protein
LQGCHSTSNNSTNVCILTGLLSNEQAGFCIYIIWEIISSK